MEEDPDLVVAYAGIFGATPDGECPCCHNRDCWSPLDSFTSLCGTSEAQLMDGSVGPPGDEQGGDLGADNASQPSFVSQPALSIACRVCGFLRIHVPIVGEYSAEG
jgi:hypothetical protein